MTGTVTQVPEEPPKITQVKPDEEVKTQITSTLEQLPPAPESIASQSAMNDELSKAQEQMNKTQDYFVKNVEISYQPPQREHSAGSANRREQTSDSKEHEKPLEVKW